MGNSTCWLLILPTAYRTNLILLEWQIQENRNKNFVCLFKISLRERVCMQREWRGKAEREEERETQADCALYTDPHMGLDFRTLRTWLELKPRVECPKDWATQASQNQNNFHGNTGARGRWEILADDDATLRQRTSLNSAGRVLQYKIILRSKDFS